MITKKDAEVLFQKLYFHMSFENGEFPNYKEIKKLFYDKALIIGYHGPRNTCFVERNIDEQLQYIDNELKTLPLITTLNLKETSIDISICEPFCMVHSKYEKVVTYGTSVIRHNGVKSAHLLKENDETKFLSLGWQQYY